MDSSAGALLPAHNVLENCSWELACERPLRSLIHGATKFDPKDYTWPISMKRQRSGGNIG